MLEYASGRAVVVGDVPAAVVLVKGDEIGAHYITRIVPVKRSYERAERCGERLLDKALSVNRRSKEPVPRHRDLPAAHTNPPLRMGLTNGRPIMLAAIDTGLIPPEMSSKTCLLTTIPYSSD